MKKTFIIKPNVTLESPPAVPCPLRIRVIRGFHLIKRKVFLRKFKLIYKQANDQGCSFSQIVTDTNSSLSPNINLNSNKRIESITVKSPGLGYVSVPVISIVDTFIAGRDAVAYARLGVYMVDIRESGENYTSPVLTYTVNENVRIRTKPVLQPVIENGKFTSVRILDPGSFEAIPFNSAFPLDFTIKIKDTSRPNDLEDVAILKAYFGITEVIMVSKGLNYVNPIVVADKSKLSDIPELKANGFANLDSDEIESLTLNHPGFGYVSNPSVTFEDNAGQNGAASSNLEILQLAIINPGRYYDKVKVKISGGGGEDIIFGDETTDNPGKVTSVNLVNGGSGYDEPPVITIEGNAQISITIEDGIITSIDLISGGSGYSKNPAITITAREGHGSGAVLTATVEEKVLGYVQKDSLGIITSIALYKKGTFFSQPTVSIEDIGDIGLDGQIGTGAVVLVSMAVKTLIVENRGTLYEDPLVVIDTPQSNLLKTDQAREFLVKYNGYSKRYPELTRLFEFPLYGVSTMSEGILIDTVGNIETYEFTSNCASSFYKHTVAYDIISYANVVYTVRGKWDKVQRKYIEVKLETFHFETDIGIYDNLNFTYVTFQFYLPRNMGKGQTDIYNEKMTDEFAVPPVFCEKFFVLTDYCFHFYPKPVQRGNVNDPNFIENQYVPQLFRPVLIVGKVVANPKFTKIFKFVYGIDSIEIRERYSIA